MPARALLAPLLTLFLTTGIANANEPHMEKLTNQWWADCRDKDF